MFNFLSALSPAKAVPIAVALAGSFTSSSATFEIFPSTNGVTVERSYTFVLLKSSFSSENVFANAAFPIVASADPFGKVTFVKLLASAKADSPISVIDVVNVTVKIASSPWNAPAPIFVIVYSAPPSSLTVAGIFRASTVPFFESTKPTRVAVLATALTSVYFQSPSL